MIEKDHGIVIHTIKYGDTSVVARIFTRQGGLLPFIVRGVRTPKARVQNSLLQPLTQVDLVYSGTLRAEGLNHIREITCSKPYRTIPFEITKTTIALFLCELLSKTLKESDPAPDLFDFLANSFNFLDQEPNPVSNFHLVCLVHVSRHLGFFPRNNFSQAQCYFNLPEGVYQTHSGASEYVLDKEWSAMFHNLTQCHITGTHQLKINHEQRRQLLRILMDYFRIHHPGFKEVKSLPVLENILR